MGQRFSFVSLDFLDEDRLLFTFRVPGLIHRDAGEGEERQIRAVVLELPAGAVEAEALWTVHDASATCGCSRAAAFCCAIGRVLS